MQARDFVRKFLFSYLEASYEIYENLHHTKISRYTEAINIIIVTLMGTAFGGVGISRLS